MAEPAELYSPPPGQLHAFGRRHEDLAAAWLAGYRNAKTRASYALSLRPVNNALEDLLYEMEDAQRRLPNVTSVADLWREAHHRTAGAA